MCCGERFGSKPREGTSTQPYGLDDVAGVGLARAGKRGLKSVLLCAYGMGANEGMPKVSGSTVSFVVVAAGVVGYLRARRGRYVPLLDEMCRMRDSIGFVVGKGLILVNSAVWWAIVAREHIATSLERLAAPLRSTRREGKHGSGAARHDHESGDEDYDEDDEAFEDVVLGGKPRTSTAGAAPPMATIHEVPSAESLCSSVASPKSGPSAEFPEAASRVDDLQSSSDGDLQFERDSDEETGADAGNASEDDDDDDDDDEEDSVSGSAPSIADSLEAPSRTGSPFHNFVGRLSNLSSTWTFVTSSEAQPSPRAVQNQGEDEAVEIIEEEEVFDDEGADERDGGEEKGVGLESSFGARAGTSFSGQDGPQREESEGEDVVVEEYDAEVVEVAFDVDGDVALDVSEQPGDARIGDDKENLSSFDAVASWFKAFAASTASSEGNKSHRAGLGAHTTANL